jgi:hypothetical protein
MAVELGRWVYYSSKKFEVFDMQNTIIYFSLFLLIIMCPVISYALTPQQVVELKKAGVSDKTIQMMIEQEEKAKDPYGHHGHERDQR